MTARFAIVTGDFVPTGGMDRANYALADYLARAGHPVELVAHRVAPELAARPGVTVHAVAKPLGSYALGSWPLARAGRRVGGRVVAGGGRAVVNGGNCPLGDINWVHYVQAAYEPQTPASRLRRVKTHLMRAIDLRREREALAAARVVICNSELTRRHVVELCGVPPERAVTVYYGSGEGLRPASGAERRALRARLGWPPDRPVALFVGAMGDRRKGFDTLFAAWCGLCRTDGWDADLVVVGSGSEKQLWEARAADSGVADRIRFLGFRADVPDLIRAADVMVAPTRYEAYGLAVHEAVCCGLPAVVSATAGVVERYPPELSELLLPDADDADGLAAKLTSWRRDFRDWPGRVAEFSAALRGRSWDDMAAEIVRAAEVNALPVPESCQV